MDRPRPDRFSDRPPSARFSSSSSPGRRPPTRFSDGPPPPRFPRGGGGDFSGSGGGRHHPYREPSQDFQGAGPGAGGGFRDRPSGAAGFSDRPGDVTGFSDAPGFRDRPGGATGFSDRPGGGTGFSDGPGFRDRPAVSTGFSDGPAAGPGFRDRPGGATGFSDRPGGGGTGFSDGPGVRDSPGGGTGFRDAPGDGPGFRDGAGGGTGFHDAPGGGPGFHDGPGGGPGFGGGSGFRDGPGGAPGFRDASGGFGQEMPAGGGGLKRGFQGSGGTPEYTDWSKFVKLFVGSVPRTATEEQIRPLFEEQGKVVEVALIKDKRTGQQQGCCFIKYATSEEADRAIRQLHNQYTLPGGTGPIQVRYADGERENLVEHKLFVASLNRQATEKEIEDIFSPYGHVEDVYLMRDEEKLSRGSGFVKFSSREMAAAALNALHGTYVMRGCDQPLIVRFANPKRPRLGESRGGPAFGGPGFGPRSEGSPYMRPMPNLDEQSGGSMFPNAWNQKSPQSLGPPSQGSNNGFHTQQAANDSTPSAASFIGGPTNESRLTAAPPLQQSFMVQAHPGAGQQTSTPQKPLVSPQELPTSLHLQQSPHILTTQSQAQNLHAPLQQFGQAQVQQSIGLPPFNQTVPSQQFPGGAVQLSAAQPLIQHNGSAMATSLQNPIGLQQQGMPTVANQQQMYQQPTQQLPQVMLQQQAQALQSSYQSSQQALLQIQQQLQQMQQSNQQQSSQTVKQQALWTEQQSTSSASSAPAAVVPLTVSATSAHPVTASIPLVCNWTEHTSPEGYKYYYNSATRESKWEKPEELAVFEQQQKMLLLQQQQQKLAVQQLQSPSQSLSQGHIQPSQQLPPTQNMQAQMQPRQQAPVQILQPSLEYQASGVSGNQNIQGSYYAQQPAANPIMDPNRAHQGIQATQEWAWKNKPAGS